MFKFNFNVNKEIEENAGGRENQEEAFLKSEDSNDGDNKECPTILPYDAKEIIPSEKHLNLLKLYKKNTLELKIDGSVTIKYVKVCAILNEIREKLKDIIVAEENHSDLLKGVYEGGAKLWECTHDLLNFVKENLSKNDSLQIKTVLDLGCGTGLLGIYLHQLGAKVHFQDYNEDVLDFITIPNLLLNCEDESPCSLLENALKRTKFYSGDWEKYKEITSEKFDLIITSETIYDINNYGKLVDIFERTLKPSGKILVGAKIHYFGVGGGIRHFEHFLKTRGHFDVKVIWTSTEGVLREILEIKRFTQR